MAKRWIERMRGAARDGGAALLGVGLLLACGGDEAPKPSGASMAGAPAVKRATGNAPPLIESVELVPERPRAGQQLRAEVVASDPDGDALELGYAWRVAGQRLDASGAAITLPQVEKGAPIEVTVTASDGSLESAPQTTRAQVGNQAPELVAVGIRPEGEVSRGKPLSAVPAASDPDGDALSFTYSWTVNGERVAETGDTLDTSKLKRGDTLRIRVVANDGEDDSNAIESPELRVANASPVIRSTPPDFEGDGSYRYALEVADPDGDRSLRYRLAHAPDGMTVDAVGGVIQWKPTAKHTGKHTVEVVVEDLQGGTTSQIFELTVAVKDPEPAPEATAKEAPKRSKIAPPAARSDADAGEDEGASLDAEEPEASVDE